MSNKKQYFNITYPFTKNNNENLFIDLNNDRVNDVRSKLLHLIFTQKGSKYRDYDFGTNLLKYIFNPNDELTWGSVNSEIKTAVLKYVPNAVIKEINILKNETTESISVNIEYGIKQGDTIIINNEIIPLN